MESYIKEGMKMYKLNKYKVPAKALRNVEDLKVGDIVWPVYGIDTATVGPPLEILEIPCTQHQKFPKRYPSKGKGISSSYFFDCKRLGWDFTDRNSCTDVNVGTDESTRYNNNWIFRSEKDAQEAILEMQGL